jgi:hypothetical protein
MTRHAFRVPSGRPAISLLLPAGSTAGAVRVDELEPLPLTADEGEWK